MSNDFDNEMAKRSWNDLYSVKAMDAAKNPTPENLREMNDVGNITRNFNNSGDD